MLEPGSRPTKIHVHVDTNVGLRVMWLTDNTTNIEYCSLTFIGMKHAYTYFFFHIKNCVTHKWPSFEAARACIEKKIHMPCKSWGGLGFQSLPPAGTGFHLWRRHDVETVSILLATCEGNHKGSLMRSLSAVSMEAVLNKQPDYHWVWMPRAFRALRKYISDI